MINEANVPNFRGFSPFVRLQGASTYRFSDQLGGNLAIPHIPCSRALEPKFKGSKDLFNSPTFLGDKFIIGLLRMSKRLFEKD